VSQRTLRARVHSLMDDIQVATCGPTPRQYDELEQLRKEMADAMSWLNGVVMDDLPELNRLLDQGGVLSTSSFIASGPAPRSAETARGRFQTPSTPSTPTPLARTSSDRRPLLLRISLRVLGV